MLKRIACCVYALILSAAIYNALLMSMHRGFINSDDTDTLMMWYGFKEHGWRFIETWRYTQDNWLLSLFPIHALMFNFLPFSPQLIVLAGLGVFLLNVLLCALIANLVQAPKSALLAPLFLLCAGEFFYTYSDITFPITHNITHFFGLLALYCAIRWIQGQNKAALVIVGLSMVVGGLSDPWYLACFSLPLLITALIMKNRYLSAAIILAIVVDITHIFGLLHFLGGADFHPANWRQFTNNLVYFINNIGLFFNFFPSISHWAALASLIIIIALMGLITFELKRKFLPLASQFFFLTISFSSIIIVISFLLYVSPPPRYLLNLFVLGILGLTMGVELYWQNFSRLIRIILGVLGVLYLISGLSTMAPLWKRPPTLPANGYDQLLKVLKDHGWSYGYANYWNANVITGLSNNAIRVRPIAFLSETGYLYWDKRKQTSPYWYSPTDIPPGQNTFFVYWQPSGDQTNLKFYLHGLTEQYGPPIQTLPYQDGFIMVWAHPLKIPLKEDLRNSWQDQARVLTVLMLI